MNPPDVSSRIRRAQAGALLIEVLISILLCAFGLLGFVAMQGRASAAEFESYQRSQALVLIEDMVSRMNANRANAGAYVSSTLIGAGALADCASLSGAALDLCEWGNLLRGSSETKAGTAVGAMLSARGCIERATGTTDRYIVSVVWSGTVATAAPSASCGKGDATYPTESLRRVVSSSVCVGLLRDPDVAAALPRC